MDCRRWPLPVSYTHLDVYKRQVLHLEKGNPWVYGVLANNIWALSSNERGGAYNNGLIQPFLHYKFEGRFYLTSAPIGTVNWKADSSQRWTCLLYTSRCV